MVQNWTSFSSIALVLIKEMNKIGVTLELLRETKIGFTLNDVRKVATEEELRKTCMEVLQSWKKLVKREGGKGSFSRKPVQCRWKQSQRKMRKVEGCTTERTRTK